MPFDRSFVPAVRAWRNDWRMWRWCRQRDLISDIEQADWGERQHRDPAIKMYGVAVAGGDVAQTLAGVCGFTDMDPWNGRAEFSLYIKPDLHGKGLGRKALRALFDHGFTNLGFNLIWGEVIDENPAITLFESMGMVREGTRRQFYFKDGQRRDAHIYSVLRSEWSTIAASLRS